jgi:hypothetical protein
MKNWVGNYSDNSAVISSINCKQSFTCQRNQNHLLTDFGAAQPGQPHALECTLRENLATREVDSTIPREMAVENAAGCGRERTESKQDA